MTQADDNPVADSPHPEERQRIRNEGAPQRYFMQVPNMADDDLGPYTLRLYVHYVRVCGADGGTCYESTETTAAKTGMSTGQVVETRRQLAQGGWIKLNKPRNPNKPITITVVDRWAENMARYSARSLHECAPSPDERAHSPHEPKNNPVKKNKLAGVRPRDAIFDFLAGEVFGVKDTAALGRAGAGRVAKLKAVVRDTLQWETEEEVLRHLKAFVRWYYGRYEGISLPRDVQKFDVFWAQYITGPGAQAETPVEDENVEDWT